MDWRRDTPATAPITDLTQAVNKFASFPPGALLTDRYLRRIALTRTDSEDLRAAIRAAELPPAWELTPDALPSPEEISRRARLIDDAVKDREQALVNLDRIERLPPLHAAALMRSVGLPERSVPALRARLSASPLLITTHEAAPGDAGPTIEQIIATATERLEELSPPSTECGRLGQELVRGDEDAIRKEADAQARAWAEFYAATDIDADDPATRAERICPRWWRRQLRRSALRAQAYFDVAFRLPRPGSKYVSNYTLGAFSERRQRNHTWASAVDVTWDDGTSVPLATIQSHAAKGRRAQLYAVTKALQWTGEQLGYIAFFLTLTLPGEFHSVSSGPRSEDGGYRHVRDVAEWAPERGPVAQHEELNRRWTSFRARLAKTPELRQYFGVIVPEPHQDGTEHLHAMVWLPVRFMRGGKSRSTRILLIRLLREIAPGRQSRLIVVEKNGEGTASPASYITTYVLKALGAEGVDVQTEAPSGEEHLIGDDHDRYRAWASARGLRRMRLLGVHGSLRIWQRLWTSTDDEPLPPRASRARRAMRAGQMAGEHAKAASDPIEVATLRNAQAAAFAEALAIIGALPHLGDGGELKLVYEETENDYGRPSKRAVAVVDPDTGETFPLRRRDARLVFREQEGDENESLDTGCSKSVHEKAVTVVAIVPREGAARRPVANPDDEAYIRTIESLIAERSCQQVWADWCDRMRSRIETLTQKATMILDTAAM